MDVENQNTTNGGSSTPDVLLPENHGNSLTHRTRHTCRPHHPHRNHYTQYTHPSPRFGTVIPNRIFVGGIDCKISESDLRRIFSQYGAVKDVNIVLDHKGMPKGYGFVTFETQDDALNILRDANGVCFKNKKLSISQAVCKLESGQSKQAPMAIPASAMYIPMSYLTQQHNTSTGYPYTYHNGVTYFHYANMNPPAPSWPQMATPVMTPQPAYQQPAYFHYQCVPNQYQWNVVQSPALPAPVASSQPSEYLYQPSDGGSAQPPPTVTEHTTPEVQTHKGMNASSSCLSCKVAHGAAGSPPSEN